MALLAAPSFAGRDLTRESLDRLEDVLSVRVEDADLHLPDLLPAIVVSLAPAYEESRGWYESAALKSLSRSLGNAGLRWCAACAAPRTIIEGDRLEQVSGAPSLPEIIRLDDTLRGTAPQARTAIWLDETTEGVSLRIIDLRQGRVLVAENVDPALKRRAKTESHFRMSRELDRRIRGDSITQLFVDLGVYPSQHISMDWTDQWGDTNLNLSGLTVSVVDPLLGLGGVYYRVIPEAFNAMVGGQLSVSLPLALINAFNQGSTNTPQLLGDNVVSLCAVVRVPIGNSNYGVVATLSTNGRFSVGLSLMNVSFLPVIP